MDKIELIWNNLTLRSGKWTNYFDIYQKELSKYEGKSFTLLEVGVKDGGSLEFWNTIFPLARVIGVDLNPNVKSLSEIFIGDQADPKFWHELFAKVGHIDVIIDDGGHGYHQQIQTVESAISTGSEMILIIEDVHSSYLKDFNANNSFTFMQYATKLAELLSARSSIHDKDRFIIDVDEDLLRKYENIKRISFYQNIVVLELTTSGRSSWGVDIVNKGISTDVIDFRYHGLNTALVPKISKNFKLNQVYTPKIKSNMTLRIKNLIQKVQSALILRLKNLIKLTLVMIRRVAKFFRNFFN
jgi:hypothetical protein